MTQNMLQQMKMAVENLSAIRNVGRVLGVRGGTIQVGGVADSATVGDRAHVQCDSREIPGEVVRLEANGTHVLLDGPLDGVCLGNRVIFEKPPIFAPDDSWIGRVIDPFGQAIDDGPIMRGPKQMPLRGEPINPSKRRAMGARLETGMTVFNTISTLTKEKRKPLQ